MRIIVSFNGLNIYFENIGNIIYDCDYITLAGASIHIVVSGVVICAVSSLVIKKSWLLTVDEVYLDIRSEEVIWQPEQD